MTMYTTYRPWYSAGHWKSPIYSSGNRFVSGNLMSMDLPAYNAANNVT